MVNPIWNYGCKIKHFERVQVKFYNCDNDIVYFRTGSVVGYIFQKEPQKYPTIIIHFDGYFQWEAIPYQNSINLMKFLF